jgi:hypothetical protein
LFSGIHHGHTSFLVGLVMRLPIIDLIFSLRTRHASSWTCHASLLEELATRPPCDDLAPDWPRVLLDRAYNLRHGLYFRHGLYPNMLHLDVLLSNQIQSSTHHQLQNQLKLSTYKNTWKHIFLFFISTFKNTWKNINLIFKKK